MSSTGWSSRSSTISKLTTSSTLHVNLELAPRATNEPLECTNCECGTFVIHDHEKLCKDCGYIAGTGHDDSEVLDEWELWRKIRNQKFEDGKEPRRRVVGSYIHVYDDYGINDDLVSDY